MPSSCLCCDDGAELAADPFGAPQPTGDMATSTTSAVEPQPRQVPDVKRPGVAAPEATGAASSPPRQPAPAAAAAGDTSGSQDGLLFREADVRHQPASSDASLSDMPDMPPQPADVAEAPEAAAAAEVTAAELSPAGATSPSAADVVQGSSPSTAPTASGATPPAGIEAGGLTVGDAAAATAVTAAAATAAATAAVASTQRDGGSKEEGVVGSDLRLEIKKRKKALWQFRRKLETLQSPSRTSKATPEKVCSSTFSTPDHDVDLPQNAHLS